MPYIIFFVNKSRQLKGTKGTQVIRKINFYSHLKIFDLSYI